jgi:hypothetical protein
MTTATKKQRRKRCSECGELKDDVDGRQRLCEECEQDKDYCHICDEWVDRAWGAGCRHVGWSNEIGCCCGCGTTHINAEAHKESFVELLKRFKPLKDDKGNPLLPRLAKQIAANNFWTQWQGPMIGGPPNLALRYRWPGRNDWYPTFADIDPSTQLAWGDEAIEAMQLGMSWLTSLDRKSIQANKITAKWIREFLNGTVSTDR